MDALDLSNNTTKFDVTKVREWKDQGIGLAIIQLISGVHLAGDSCQSQILACLDGGLAVDCYLFPSNDGLSLTTNQRLNLVPAEARVKIRQLWTDVEPAFSNPNKASVNKTHAQCDVWAPWQACGDYCLTPEARVLTMDLDWVHAGELRTGDAILGFDEDTGMGGRRSVLGHKRARQYQPARVTGAERTQADVFAMTLSDGTVLHATGEHKWLVSTQYSSGNQARSVLWVRTEDLAKRGYVTDQYGIRRSLKNCILPQYIKPWRRASDYAGGFLAAAFDGEGSLSFDQRMSRPRLGFSQKPNAMLAEVIAYLDDYGYQSNSFRNKKPGVVNLRLTGGTGASVRFLGEMRPPRLLDKWRLASTDGLPLEMRCESLVGIESVKFVGKKEIAAISSSSGTYVAEGFGSHNTALWVAQKMGWLPWPWPNRKQWLVNVFNDGHSNLGGTFSGTNNHVMTQYHEDVVLSGVSGIDRSLLSDSEALEVTKWLGGPMAITVGDGMKIQMDAASDAPLCDHVEYDQVDDDGVTYKVERCQGSKGVFISSNSSGNWVNVGPL